MKTLLFLLALVPFGLPAIKAQPRHATPLRVLVEWQKATLGPGGLIITGKIRNTGGRALVYTQIVPLLCDRGGRVIYRGSGYLTVSPLLPGQAAEFRDREADAPAFSRLSLMLREAGRPVVVTAPPLTTRTTGCAPPRLANAR